MKKFAYYVHPEQYVHAVYQITFWLITSVILAILLHKPITEFHPMSHSPRIHSITSEVIAQWGTTPLQIQTGMHITDFLRFDTVKNEFIINAFIWFMFDSDKVPLSIIEQFAFTKGEILHKSKVLLKKEGNLSFALYSLRLQFSSILDYARFPLDDHRLFLNLTNPALSADHMYYQARPNDYIISENLFISGWNIVGHNAESGYATIPLGDHKKLLQSKTVFSIDLSKGDLRQLSLILLPLLFLFYLGLFSFSIPDLTVAITLPLGSAAGLLAYSFVIQTLAPAVGYMMLSDYLFLFFLCSTFIIMLVKALGALPEHWLTKRRLRTIEGLTIALLNVSLIVVWYLLMKPN